MKRVYFLILSLIFIALGICGIYKIRTEQNTLKEKEKITLICADKTMANSFDAKLSHDESIFELQRLDIEFNYTTGKITEAKKNQQLIDFNYKKDINDVQTRTNVKLYANAANYYIIIEKKCTEFIISTFILSMFLIFIFIRSKE